MLQEYNGIFELKIKILNAELKWKYFITSCNFTLLFVWYFWWSKLYLSLNVSIIWMLILYRKLTYLNQTLNNHFYLWFSTSWKRNTDINFLKKNEILYKLEITFENAFLKLRCISTLLGKNSYYFRFKRMLYM